MRFRPLKPRGLTPASRRLGVARKVPGDAVPDEHKLRIRTGVDLARIDTVAASVHELGDRYLKRIYTAAEIAYAQAGGALCNQRLAARFAAKEAVIKALSLSDVGVAWTSMEVVRGDHGEPQLRLHGHAALQAQRLGVRSSSLSLSHDGDYAMAVVTLLCLDTQTK
jgi:holo-[acyl-carrier protein] synthase